LVEVDAGLRHVDDGACVHVLGERGAGEHAHRDRAPVTGGDLPGAALVVPGDQGDEVGGDQLGGLERPGRDPVRSGRRGRGGGGGDDAPVRGGGDRQGVGGLEVRLFEAGEHAPGVGDLELRVEVDLVVDRVHEAVQALAGVHVPTGGEDAQGVRALG